MRLYIDDMQIKKLHESLPYSQTWCGISPFIQVTILIFKD